MKTDNEIIAEFMGLDVDGDNVTDGTIETTIGKLKYSTSWDWLMPVVEKINETIYPELNERIDVIIYRRTCHINDRQQIIIETTGKNMLDCTYKAVVEFIKWHNQKTP